MVFAYVLVQGWLIDPNGTLILISLEMFCSSLPTILKLLMLVVWPVVLLWSCIGDGAFRCSLNLSPNVLAVSPIYSSSQSNLLHLNLYILCHFCWSCGLGLLEPPVHPLGSCHFWNELECHISCQCFSYSHLSLHCME